MSLKTPKFDKALDKYFAKLELDEKGGSSSRSPRWSSGEAGQSGIRPREGGGPPLAGASLAQQGGQWRTCRFSGEKFYVRPEDIDFYEKIKVPLPTIAPEEHRRRRCASYNSYTLFKKIPLPRINPHTRMSAWRKEFNIVVRLHRRNCVRCGKEIQTTYAPDRPEKNIWCEACYLEMIG